LNNLLSLGNSLHMRLNEKMPYLVYLVLGH